MTLTRRGFLGMVAGLVLAPATTWKGLARKSPDGIGYAAYYPPPSEIRTCWEMGPWTAQRCGPATCISPRGHEGLHDDGAGTRWGEWYTQADPKANPKVLVRHFYRTRDGEEWFGLETMT